MFIVELVSLIINWGVLSEIIDSGLFCGVKQIFSSNEETELALSDV